MLLWFKRLLNIPNMLYKLLCVQLIILEAHAFYPNDDEVSMQYRSHLCETAFYDIAPLVIALAEEDKNAHKQHTRKRRPK